MHPFDLERRMPLVHRSALDEARSARAPDLAGAPVHHAAESTAARRVAQLHDR